MERISSWICKEMEKRGLTIAQIDSEVMELIRALLYKYEQDVTAAEIHSKHCEDYINKFNKSIRECETPEGRDAIRLAQMYIKSVDVDTKSKYDNTAYILGLASILSKENINAIGELRKIKNELP
jgi:hypothetical protein